MEKWKQMAITVISVSLSSQIYVSVFTEGFIVAISPLFFVVFLYLYPELNPLKTGLVVGFISPFFRSVVQAAATGNLADSLLTGMPDVIFFYTFTLLFCLFQVHSAATHSQYTRFFLSVVICDFLANVTEMVFRIGGLPDGETINGLALFAALRTFGTLLVVFSINRYKSLLAKEEHEQRYKKLMVMAANLNGEVYFMNKNMVEIEDVMKKAFTLYRDMEKDSYPSSMQSLCLDIAKDVHEIKKDYIRVIRGIQDGFFADIEVKGMDIRDIVRILEMDIREQIREKRLQIEFVHRVKPHFYVEHHFSLMSVLRNLALNSMDAIGDDRGTISLHIEEDEAHGLYIMEVSDNGPGIKPADMDIIFHPGYSTKFSQETGAIYRGVGLTLVRDLIVDKFNGTIQVSSKPGEQTVFHIEIPQKEFFSQS